MKLIFFVTSIFALLAFFDFGLGWRSGDFSLAQSVGFGVFLTIYGEAHKRMWGN